ncbi:MAG: hypothetical protein E7287_06370 [Lachnospiraceae bacterium]|nr:hypothetical protein [Lachnospiraceae bacterium]
MLEYLKEPMVNCFACMKLNSLDEVKREVAHAFLDYLLKEKVARRIYENTIQYAILKKEWER